MEEKFGEFFQDKNYIKIKNNLFNYLNRKNQINKIFIKYKNKNDLKILDIGSGISPVSPMPSKTLFIDLSKTGIEILTKKNYNAKIGSITKIPEPKNKFDWVFCSEVLEHIKDYKKAIEELTRVTKKHGKIIITVPVHKKYWDIDDEFVEHYRRFDPKVLKNDLKKANLKILEEKPIGSIIERYLTITMVKIFNSRKEKTISNKKLPLIILINKLLYLVVKSSLIFNSKNSTSIMMYVCEKK